MATGMVLIIVSRNIDLSVGSLLGFLGYTMALIQTDGILSFFGVDVTVNGLQGKAFVWVVALAFGLLLGAAVGFLQGFLVAYGGVPAFIVTLGGFLVWRGLIFRTRGPAGPDARPARADVPAPLGWRGEGLARRVAELARRAPRLRGHRAEPRVRPPAPPAPRARRAPDVGRDRAVRARAARQSSPASGLVANRYESPITHKATGIAYPVVILIGVTLLMNYVARRRASAATCTRTAATPRPPSSAASTPGGPS